MRISRATIDIGATCGGAMRDDMRITCSWRRLYGSNRQIRAAARRHAATTGHGVSVEETTDTIYRAEDVRRG